MKQTLLSLSLSLCFISVFGLAYSDEYPSAADFVNCLETNKNRIPPNQIYSKWVTSFTSVLNAHIKNLRFERETTPKPLIIVAPTNESQVPTVVLCARQSNIHLIIRSGGHDYEGLSYVSNIDDNFVILDMFNLNSISVDPNTKTAVVGAGALLGQLYHAISEASETLAFPAGVCLSVGVGGHISGGGYGNLIRKFGLSVDNMISAKIVVADGSVLTVSGKDDLFWALRGGGGASFGVVLSYKLKLVTIETNVTVFQVERYQNTKILYDYQECTQTCGRNLFIRVLLHPITVDATLNREILTTYIGMYVGNATSLVQEVGRNFRSLGLDETDCEEMSWIDSVHFWANFDKTTDPSDGHVGYFKRKSDYVKEKIAISDLEALLAKMVKMANPWLVFNSYGGAMTEINASETAFPHRAGNLFKIQYSITWMGEGKEFEDGYMAEIREFYEYMTPYVSSNPRQSYLNYRDLDIGTNNGTDNYTLGQVYGRKYFNKNFDRLVDIKTAVDPDNFFRYEQSIPTKPTT